MAEVLGFTLNLYYIPDNIYPARGRKQRDAIRLISTFIKFPTIFTPQGDGNVLAISIGVMRSLNSRQYLPRKGTETNLIPVFNRCLAFYSRQYLPRKGTETSLAKNDPFSGVFYKFPTIFTPQGDGNSISNSFLTCCTFSLFPTIFTPQGDGNGTSINRSIVF